MHIIVFSVYVLNHWNRGSEIGGRDIHALHNIFVFSSPNCERGNSK